MQMLSTHYTSSGRTHRSKGCPCVGSCGGWGRAPSKVHLESFWRLKYSNRREIFVFSFVCLHSLQMVQNWSLYWRKGRVKLGWSACDGLHRGFLVLFHHRCVAVYYPDTLRVAKGLRVEQGRQWEDVSQKCYGTNCAFTPKSHLFQCIT